MLVNLEDCKVIVMYFCFILFLNLMFAGVFYDWILVGFLLSFRMCSSGFGWVQQDLVGFYIVSLQWFWLDLGRVMCSG